ncbi:MAG: GNAT family N-acetyltransferase [Actinomycetota bacterium]|nr:GNAT family N-acetyltransferase [Actinomycetota bacterium]
MAAQNFQVAIIGTEETYALRTAVLRAGTPTADPKYAEDLKPGTIHLGIFDEHKNLIATSTWVINPWQDDPSATAIQLRGMAVATSHQKSGLGKLLLDAGISHAKKHDAKYIWAKARDSALAFYLRNSFVSVGDGFTESVTQMPHHLVVSKI